MRFVRSGVNWEGRTWTTPLSLRALLDAVEAWQPAPRAADGTVASAGHDAANPTSDHRPNPYTGPGTVRAVDIGENGDEGPTIFTALLNSRDPRIKYAIHNGQIFASYTTPTRPAWTLGTYTGSNPHFTHVHVSTVAAQDANGKPWNLNLQPGDDDMEVIKAIQKQCNAGGFTSDDGKPLKVDGIMGAKTQQAMNALAKAAAQDKGITRKTADGLYVPKDTPVKIG